jgi:hypothetical protein
MSRCVWSLSPAGVTSTSIIQSYADMPPESGDPHAEAQAGLEREDLYFAITSRTTVARRQLYELAGLIELAASVGYVDLGEWDGLTAFAAALEGFEQAEASRQAYPTDLALVRELRGRLERQDYRAASIDDDFFYAFASYLQLSNIIRRDLRLSWFLFNTERWSSYGSNSDLAFLGTPAHFSEALATGAIKGIPAYDLMNGLVALDCFRWFTEILNRTSRDQKIADKFIRHARWSHRIEQVKKRIGVWAVRIREWDELAGEPDDLMAPDVELRRALRPSAYDLAHLGLAERSAPPASSYLPVGLPSLREVLEQTERLLAEGRKGAAKKALRAALERFDQYFERHAGIEDWISDRPAQMVELARRLAALGDTDAAAVVLAKHADRLVDVLGMQSETTRDALAVIAQTPEAAHDHAGELIAKEPEETIIEVEEAQYSPQRDAEA